MESFLGSSIVNVLLSVFANVLTTVLFSVGRKGYEVIQGKEPLKVHLDTNLTPILQKAVAAVARSSQFNDPIQTEKLQKFLVSPEVEALVRQIYANKLVSSEASHSKHSKLIRKEFIALFALNIDSSSKTLDDLANEIFEAIFAGCEKALEVAINRGVLAAHEAKSAIRYQMLYDELATIKKNLKFLTGQQQINIEEILEFENKYRQQISNRHGYIIPPNFDTAKKINIDQLYVCPGFIRMPSSREEQPETLNIDNFRSVIYRSVLLGNPGGGKSTFTDKLCHDLATRYSDKLLAGRQVTPIHVVLRDYGSEKKKNNCSILQFIHTTASSKYQLPPTLLSTFEYLLLNGRVVVIFDGLDELIDTSYRQDISKNVESFCSLYPSVPVLVTSREVGYNEARLDEGKFEIFHLDLFNHNQVKDYVDKWFAVTASELNKEQRDQKVQAFIEESSAVPDLRSNPLMLALLCNIYRGENYIPKNRPDVYEKCSEMLFERWDKNRGIQVSLPFESRIIFAMMYLAHWIYTNETLQGGVTERQLIAQVTDYLCPRQFDDRDEAESAGCKFIEFCRGRAWVFTDTGTTKDGESLYQFTHRTFLEYFTAKHLVRISPSSENLQEILLPKISKREWDVVAQLAFRIQDKQTDRAGDKLLTALIKKSDETEGSEKWNLIFFATRCLEFMVPNPSVRREITKACIEFCIEWGIDRIKNKQLLSKKYHDFDIDPPAVELLSKLLNSAVENRKTIAESWKELIIEQINGQDDNKSFIAYEIGIHSNITFYFNHLSETIERKECIKFWGDISENIFETCLDRIKILSSKYYLVWLDCIDKGKISILNLVSHYTINHIFEEQQYTVFPGLSRLFAAETIFYRTFLPESFKAKDRLKLNLNELGQILTNYSTNSMTLITELKFNISLTLHSTIRRNISTNYQEIKQLQLSANAIFAAFFILAVFLEINLEDLQEKKDIIEMIKRKHLPLLDSFQYTFLSRFDQVKTNKIQEELEQSSLAPEHQVFVWKWVRKEINLVAKSKHQGLKLP